MGKRVIPAKVLEMIHAACEGTLPDEDVAELESALLTDSEACQMFLAMMDLEIELGVQCQETRALRDVLKATSENSELAARHDHASLQRGWLTGKIQQAREFWSAHLPPGLSSRRTQLSLTVAACVVSVIVAVMAFITMPKFSGRDQEYARVESGRQLAAQLTGEHQAAWAAGQIGTVVGAQLYPGHRMELTRGLAEVAFSSGAKIVIEGPAQLRIDGRNQCTLTSGKIVSQVPPAAIGFSVRTPNCKVVDLGTKFGVEVEVASGTLALVMQGVVELHRIDTQGKSVETLRLEAGQAGRAMAEGFGLAAASAAPEFTQALPAPPPQMLLTNASFEQPRLDGNANEEQYLNTPIPRWAFVIEQGGHVVPGVQDPASAFFGSAHPLPAPFAGNQVGFINFHNPGGVARIDSPFVATLGDSDFCELRVAVGARNTRELGEFRCEVLLVSETGQELGEPAMVSLVHGDSPQNVVELTYTLNVAREVPAAVGQRVKVRIRAGNVGDRFAQICFDNVRIKIVQRE